MNNLTVREIVNSYDLFEYIGSVVEIKKIGNEASCCCPIHGEKLPSFTIFAKNNKQRFRCFGCGINGDIVDFVKIHEQCTTKEAIDYITGRKQHESNRPARKPVIIDSIDHYADFEVLPLCGNAIRVGEKINVFNPKKNKIWAMTPTAAHRYDDGYVLRVQFGETKVTPTVLWCRRISDNMCGWVAHPFPQENRKIYGNLRETGPVFLVEGEKCVDHTANIVKNHSEISVICWPGGTNGIDKVDWTPLVGRDIIALPDNDLVGFIAMLSISFKVGKMRFIDPSGQAKGFDIADTNFNYTQLFDYMTSRMIDYDEFEEKTRVMEMAHKLKLLKQDKK